jgi:hypothetical protein
LPSITGYAVRREIIYAGTPPSIVSARKTPLAEEAKRRDKPLPPNGPVSPSAIPGRVEIGCPLNERERGEQLDGRMKKGIRTMFQWGRKKCPHESVGWI